MKVGAVARFVAIILVGFVGSSVLIASEPKKDVVVNSAKAGNAASDPAAGKPATRSALGMSVTGTQEAPKVLYIVPWKTLDAVPSDPYVSGLLDEVFAPVDPVVFERGVRQFDQMHQESAPLPATVTEK